MATDLFISQKRAGAPWSATPSAARARPELFPDQPATVSGVKASIDNTDWILTKASHTLSDGGFTTALELEIKTTEIPD